MTMTEGLLYLYAKHTIIWIICSSVTERWSVWVCRGCECVCVYARTDPQFWFSGQFWPGRTGWRWRSLYHHCSGACSWQPASAKIERQSKTQKMEENTPDGFCVCVCTLQATRWGQSFPNPSGGWILLSKATTSKCLIRPLENKHTFNQT